VTDAPPLLWDDAPGATVTVLLAAGAGADCRSEFLQRTAAALAQASLRVARFDFPYMQQRTAGPRRGPDPTPVLLACMRAAAAATGVPPALLSSAEKVRPRIGLTPSMLKKSAETTNVGVRTGSLPPRTVVS